MFSFIKKTGSGSGGNVAAILIDKEEKERKKKKKERKEKEKKEKGSVAGEDIARSDEGRISLKLRHRRKDKEKEKLPSGITADYSANFFGDFSRDRIVQSTNVGDMHSSLGCPSADAAVPSLSVKSCTTTSTPLSLQHRSLPLPPLPPRQTKKAVPSSRSKSPNNQPGSGNVLHGELNVADSGASASGGVVRGIAAADDTVDFSRTGFYETTDHLPLLTPSLLVSNYDKGGGNGDVVNEKYVSIESLTDSTTNSSFATPPFSSSPVGEGQGYYSKFADLALNSSPDDDRVCEFPLPDIEPHPYTGTHRELIISRRGAKSDLGLELHRVITADRASGLFRLRSVVLAETNSQSEAVLLPGHQLLEVNGVSVGDTTKEDIFEIIKSSESVVKVKVRLLPELCEVIGEYDGEGTHIDTGEGNVQFEALRFCGNKRSKCFQGKSDEQLETEKLWLDCEKMWLMHKSGFTAVRVLSRSLDSGKVGIRLEATGEQATVDEDDVEPANPTLLDQCEDLTLLRYLNESSSLHVLRQRFGSNLIHTYAGPTMIIINPMMSLYIYSNKVARIFRGRKAENMPAHVFSMAQSTFHETITSRRDHSVVFIGRSGSGKTVNYKHILQYLVATASHSSKVLDTEKLNAIWTILESFGNAKTSLNNNATRFSHLFSLNFDHCGKIVSASVQLFSCEKWRLVRRSESEQTFHIFYKFLAGADGALRKELALDQIASSEQNIFFTPLQKFEEKERASTDLGRICSSFKLVGVSDMELKTIFSVLAGIVHLGYAGVSRSSSSGKWQFSHPAAAKRAAKCLGTTVEELSRLIFVQTVATPTNVSRAHCRNVSSTDPAKLILNDDCAGSDSFEGFVVGLYVELFNLVGSYVNRCITANVHFVTSILVLDYPGFQNPASCGQLQDGASFNDLCDNYFHERLQLLFHRANLDIPRERYSQEKVDVNLDRCDDGSSEAIVNLLDCSSATSYSRGSPVESKQSPSKDKQVPGLLWLLDDIGSLHPPSEHQFVDKVFSLHPDIENHHLIRKAPGNNHFIIQHCQGTNPVLYRVDGWLKQSKENPFIKSASTFLQDSKNREIVSAFADCRGAGLTSCVTVLDCGTQSLRRVSSIRRTFATGFRRRSQLLQFKFTVDGIIETLRKTRVKFAHCFLPHHDAGLTDKNGSGTLYSSSNSAHSSAINVPLLRSQLRGSEILSVVRLHKQGFPTSMFLSEFGRRFSSLAKNDPFAGSADDRTVVEKILNDAEVEDSSYRIGSNEVFFRNGVLSRLESLRDDKLADRVVQLQAYCRGYLSRKQLAKLKIEDVAIRCIQRNVGKFMSVRNWPWWRLLIRIAPLLNVHRAEQELKTKTEEVETLRTLCEKLEQERNSLRQENLKLGVKLNEMTVELAEEHSAADSAGERLQLETAERLRLADQARYLQNQNQSLRENGEKLETELLCLQTAELDGTTSVEDEQSWAAATAGESAAYKQRCERAVRELEYTKRRLQQQHHDDLEQLVALRKQLEKKISDAYEQVDEQRQAVAQWKRKVQKLNGETSDLRLMLEDGNSRNSVLEKKQRKFDSEVQMLQDELRQERQSRERVTREKDSLAGDKYALEQHLQTLKMDLELKDQKLTNLNRELHETTYGVTTEEEVSRLRKIKHELENKVAEQDEELDDLAGQVHLLEHAKLRLEMNVEQMRKEHKKELSQRDEENEEIRCNTMKKVKALECQLEDEHEERSLLLRERHELERKLADVEERERCGRSSDQELVARLKRDLKKTKILLQDCRLMLQQAKTDLPNKAMLRQLRNQLEDAECARNAALKARQMAEADLADVASTLEEVQKAKTDAEEKAACYARERSQLQSQLDENEEELAEVLKKYRNTVQQLSSEQLTLHEQANRIAELESERCSLKEQLAEVTWRLENIETHGDPTSSLAVKRLELKTKELESKLDLEQTTRSRMEVQIGRLKEAAERFHQEADAARAKEASAHETVRKLQRALREARELQASSETKQTSEASRKRDLEKRIEQLEIELTSAKADLKLALQRVDDLQCAIQGDLEDGDDDDDDDDDDDEPTDCDRDESVSSNESLRSFVTQQTNGRLSIDRWLNNGTESEHSKS